MKQKWVFACVGALLAAVAVYIASGYLHRPQMREAEVMEIANTAAAKEGFRLSEYETPIARFEFPDRNRTWRVMYDLKLPTPWRPRLPQPQSAHGAPRHIFVIVDDLTGHPQVGMLRAVGASQPVSPPPGVKVFEYSTNQGWSDSKTN